MPSIAELDAAVALVMDLQYDEARPRLADLVDRFDAVGDREHAAEALFWLSYCYEKTGNLDQAGVFYGEVVRRYPETPAAEQARQRQVHLTATPVP